MPDLPTPSKGRPELPPTLRDRLQELVLLYTKTKRYVLLAEQRDPDSKSNIAVFKEQRDALDHLMRAALRFYITNYPENWGLADENEQNLLDDGVLEEPESPDFEQYFSVQIDKATGHLFRAAYDALDGMGISLRTRLSKAVGDSNNEALDKVYPHYWEHLATMDALECRFGHHRECKDVGSNHTLKNLSKYWADIEKAFEIVGEAESRAGGLARHMKTQRVENRKWKIIIPASIVLLGVMTAAFLDWVRDKKTNAGTAPPPALGSPPRATNEAVAPDDGASQ